MQAILKSDDRFDVAVTGAGAAGLAAAIAAARSGSKVLLVDKADRVGGTVTHALIHTIAGLYDKEGVPLYTGLPHELTQRLEKSNPRVRQRQIGKAWVLNTDPDWYLEVVTRWLAEHTNLTVVCGAVLEAVHSAGSRIDSISLNNATVPVRNLIDTSGAGAAVRLAAPERVKHTSTRAAGGLILSLRDVEADALGFPAHATIHHAIKEAAGKGLLPADCSKAWLDSGIQPDECYMKLFVPLQNGDEASATARAVEASHQLLACLKKEFPAFRYAYIDKTGALGIRDNGQVEGQYCLTAEDVRSGKRFDDAACKAGWPIEYWHPEHGLELEYLNSAYDIPMRSLAVAGFDNLWTAGKCISADPLARASARVVGTCWAMGEAAGIAASRK